MAETQVPTEIGGVPTWLLGVGAVGGFLVYWVFLRERGAGPVQIEAGVGGAVPGVAADIVGQFQAQIKTLQDKIAETTDDLQTALEEEDEQQAQALSNAVAALHEQLAAVQGIAATSLQDAIVALRGNIATQSTAFQQALAQQSAQLSGQIGQQAQQIEALRQVLGGYVSTETLSSTLQDLRNQISSLAAQTTWTNRLEEALLAVATARGRLNAASGGWNSNYWYNAPLSAIVSEIQSGRVFTSGNAEDTWIRNTLLNLPQRTVAELNHILEVHGGHSHA